VRILLVLTVFVALVVLPVPAVTAQEPRWHEAEEGVFETICEYRDDIAGQAELFGVDPRLVAAILYVEKVQYVLDDWLRLRHNLETAAAEYFFFIRDVLFWADLSTGYCRIKPSFARQTRQMLLEDSAAPARLTADDVDPSLYYDSASLSIRIMCAGLYVLERQWRNAGFDISQSPEILATLYNLGYEKSVPNAKPSSGGSDFPVINNGVFITGMNFGERVLLVLEESVLLGRLFHDPSQGDTVLWDVILTEPVL
jgi:hypothetical protein